MLLRVLKKHVHVCAGSFHLQVCAACLCAVPALSCLQAFTGSEVLAAFYSLKKRSFYPAFFNPWQAACLQRTNEELMLVLTFVKLKCKVACFFSSPSPPSLEVELDILHFFQGNKNANDEFAAFRELVLCLAPVLFPEFSDGRVCAGMYFSC